MRSQLTSQRKVSRLTSLVFVSPRRSCSLVRLIHKPVLATSNKSELSTSSRLRSVLNKFGMAAEEGDHAAVDVGSSTTTAGAKTVLRFADVGINLTDSMYNGVYHRKKHHEADLDDVVQRALDAGCSKLMVTGSDLQESEQAIEICRRYPGTCYATVGVHPCQVTAFHKNEAGSEDYMNRIRDLALKASAEGIAVAFGEFGLDYDRLHYAPKDAQLEYFEKQLDLAEELQLPLFLHSRAAGVDFERLLKPRLPKLPKSGLVHSFTGSVDEMRSLVDLGLDIGVNGCSLKTEENLEVVKNIPLERLQMETDGPWCGIKQTHASSKRLQGAPQMPKPVKKEKWVKGSIVKDRNEPCTISLVAHVIANVKGCSVEDVCEAAWKNSIKMFGLGEKLDCQ